MINVARFPRRCHAGVALNLRSPARCLNSIGFPEEKTYPAVPGLLLYPHVLDDAGCREVLAKVRSFATEIRASAAASNRPAIRSPAHNLAYLSGDEHFIRVALPGGPGTSFSTEGNQSNTYSCNLRGEHFSQYGDGHQLTYFRGNENIPLLGLGEDWLLRLASIPIVQTELSTSRAKRGLSPTALVRWRMTFNEYSVQPEKNTRPGFPWHCDLEANGAATIILALCSPAILEFAHPPPNFTDETATLEPIAKVQILPGSLLVLAGPARWDFLHRVVGTTGECLQERYSLVFGCW